METLKLNVFISKNMLAILNSGLSTFNKKRSKQAIVFCLCLLTGKALLAYPIPPQTLRRLIENSQYIVIARIDNPEKGEKWFDSKINDTLMSFTFGGDGLADLHITEILKGSLSSNIIFVKYEAGMVCPAPPSYPDQKMVIAFLNKEDTATTYYTVGLSYGSKIMNTETELNAYRKSILDYMDILKLKTKHQRSKATLEWLVKCAENPYTRWEGAYELSRQGYYMSFYDRSKDRELYKKLDLLQVQRLESVFFSTDTLGYTELCFVNIIPEKHHAQLKAKLLDNLIFADYYLQDDIMKQIIMIFPDTGLEKLYDETTTTSYDDTEKESKRNALVRSFMEAAKKSN